MWPLLWGLITFIWLSKSFVGWLGLFTTKYNYNYKVIIMYFYASLFAAFVITLIVVSKIAEMLLAKRPKIAWVLLASLVGSGAAVVSYLLLSLFVAGIDPMVMLIVSLSTMFIVSSAAFKHINQMSWKGAITTNIANIVIVLITMTAAVVLNGKSLEEEFLAVNTMVKDNMLIVEPVTLEYENDVAIEGGSLEIEGDSPMLDGEKALLDEVAEENEFEEGEPLITERDLLSAGAVKELERRERVVYKEPKYHVTNVGNVRTLVGYTVRILKSNGNTISGALKKVSGSEVYVEQRIANGIAVAPIAIAKIRKLEVYRK